MRSETHGRRGLSRLVSVAAVSAVAGAALLAAAPAQAADETVIDVYTMNDFHGHIESDPASGEAGAASIATAYATLAAQNPGGSTLVSAGDNVSASPFVSAVADDQPTIDVLNQIGLSASAVGNHEFDKGRADLDDRIVPAADWDYISSNLFEKGTEEHAYAPYDLQTFDGVTVGFIGATTEALPTLVDPAGIATLDVRPIVASVNAVADELTDGDEANGEADVLMVVMHEGGSDGDFVGGATVDAPSTFADPTSVLAKIVNGVGSRADAFITGHTHAVYDRTVDIDGKLIPVLETGVYGSNLGHVSVTYDKDTSEYSVTGDLIPLVVDGALVYPEDPEVAATVATAVAEAAPLGEVSAGSITGDIFRGSDTVYGPVDKGNENRAAQSAAGNLLADAMLSETSDIGSEIAFMNPGGVRTDLLYASGGATDPDGNVSVAELYTLQPFGNTIFSGVMTGAQIETVLEEQWAYAGRGADIPDRATDLRLGVSAGFSYTYDPTAAWGQRVDEMFYQGEAITPDESFTVVGPSFFFSGGDGFTGFTEASSVADSGRGDVQVLEDYFAENSPVSPDTATRGVGVHETSAEGADEFTFDLSSLDVNNVDPASLDTEVVVSVDGVETSRAPIDHTFASDNGEQGKATVTVPVSADLAEGEHEFAFALPSNGVTLSYTFTVTEDAGTTPTPTPTPEPTETVIPTTPATTAPAVPGASGGPTKHLAATGVDATPAFAAGAAALLLGLGMTVARLRRRTAAK
ncbi:bifunctional UDP-sugar hydrolase/5'-nucleotidase [Rathayibacter sp. VKM Ac-2857]|uniref:bifunctional metallophosphatase/5'-nucleotidase n=1 Tax=Rathayibacter sp. VKM Ac-2857 TaxID=2739020 RepID=UPI00156545D2|nr:5'-nucleotidase C-terminal domain-containing protein [Rathayibacter sp. VKM Ac-2857]NQX16828.1 5'-nucleotidase C-terminal domain-containing protein [Rathayibacter sp. VKM Ac-2857]